MPQRLAQHLISRGLLKASTVDEALRRMGREGGSLDTNLLEMAAISEAGILQAISDVSNLRLVNLADFEPNSDAAPVMPYKMAKQLGVVPLSVDGIALHIACTYPIPQNQLKDVGFLLGRKLELWVSLEVRVKSWQSLVYGQPLETRLTQLMAALDPPKRISKIVAPKEVTRRATSPDLDESLSPEVLERIAQGIVDEPVLLSTPKKRTSGITAAPPEALGYGEEPTTSVVDASAYSRYAKVSATKTVEQRKPLGDGDAVPTIEVARPKLPSPEDSQESTRMLDTANYEQYARRETGGLDAPTQPIRFPGGVAPPRKSIPDAPSRMRTEQSAWVQPAIPSRPPLNRSTESAPAPLPAQPPPRTSSPSAITASHASLRQTQPVLDPVGARAAATDADRTQASASRSAQALAPVASSPSRAGITVPPPPPAAARPSATSAVAPAQPPAARAPESSPSRAPMPDLQPSAGRPLESSPSRAAVPPPQPSAGRARESSPSRPAVAPPPPPPSAARPSTGSRIAVPVSALEPEGPTIRASSPVSAPPTAPREPQLLVTRDPRPDYSAEPPEEISVEFEAPAEDTAPPQVDSQFTELSDNETDFSDVDADVNAAVAAKRQNAAVAAPERAAAQAPPPAPSPVPSLPMPSAPSPVPQRSEPWQMIQNAPLMSPPAPQTPAVPLAGLQLTPGDPNISAAPPGLAAANASEWTLAQARQSLKSASLDREQLISVMLDYGRRTFEFVGAFAVMRGAAYGWDARGDSDTSAVRNVSIPLDAASVFRTVAMTRGSYVGPLPPDALSQHYLAQFGRSPRTVFVWPVEVQSRLVAIIYGDCGGRPVSQRRLSDFILFCQDLPAAFHDLIVFRKLNPPVAPEYTEPTALQDQLPTELPTDADWFHGLLSLLTGPDPSERSMAMVELLKTPEASALALAGAFPGPTGWSRLPVVELPEPDELGPIPGALARLGAIGATALAPLLDSNDSDTRYLALLTAGSLRYPDVVDGVLRGLFDLEPDISSAARSAAAWLKYLPAFYARMPDLRRELAANDPLRRSLAARALGVLHDREAIDGLINLTGSEDELCATSAAEALKEVTRTSFGTNPQAWSGWWAGARGQRRIEWLVDALRSDDFDLRLSAIEELSRTFGDNYGFFADGPPGERADAVARWHEVVVSRPDLEL